MKIITTTGFYCTGSSAVTDLLMEYDNIACKSDLEIRLLHDPFGVSDLEYNLIENPNRHNSGYYIKRFYRHMKMLNRVWCFKRFSKYFNGKFMDIINEYIANITTLEYNSVWHFDVYDRGNAFYVASRIERKINSVLHKIFRVPLDNRNLVPKKEKAYLTIVDEEKFLLETRKMVKKLTEALCPEGKDYVCFDQFVPPSNIARYQRYADDMKVVVVDRDPRDIYVLEKKFVKGAIVPKKSIEDYCKWYKWTRELLKIKNEGDYLFIKFEDLVYKYDETVDSISKYLGLNEKNHINPKSHFKPEVSINNTQLWKSFPGYDKDIQYIEQELKDYLYDFPEKDNTKINEVF